VFNTIPGIEIKIFAIVTETFVARWTPLAGVLSSPMYKQVHLQEFSLKLNEYPVKLTSICNLAGTVEQQQT
jgi:hypothetical protein